MSSLNISAKQKLVLDAINEHPEAANNDALLFSLIWLREGWSSDRPLYENLSRVTRPETISRRRRELYNLGLITYSSDALKTRDEAYRAEQDAHSRAFDNILGSPMDQLLNLTVKPSDDTPSAVSWLND